MIPLTANSFFKLLPFKFIEWEFFYMELEGMMANLIRKTPCEKCYREKLCFIKNRSELFGIQIMQAPEEFTVTVECEHFHEKVIG
jgi:hypothetical protein